MRLLTFNRLSDSIEGRSQRKDLSSDQQIFVIGADRMPVDAIGRNRDLRHEIGARHDHAVLRKSTTGNPTNDAILRLDVVQIEKPVETRLLFIGRDRGGQPNTESFSSHYLDAQPGTPPCAGPAMTIVQFRIRTVETDLKGDPLARKGARGTQLLSREQHSVGQHDGRRHAGAFKNDGPDVGQKERLSAGEIDLSNSDNPGLFRNPADGLQPELASSGAWR